MSDLYHCRIAGIPASLRVTSYYPGSYDRYGADSDMDYYGSLEYDVCDSRGRKAPWLERKLLDVERRRHEVDLERAIRAGELEDCP